MKTLYIAGNWKMNMSPSQAEIFMQELIASIPAAHDRCEVIVCPPYLALSTVAKQSENTRIMLG
ncbi:MAG TPA: triose-phosphate isomerase, partial [Candidatus Kapabacteria bacterium]|nr:triose-phosphate isomerase [Candidatus Kapabacteria bacterium]